MDDRELVARALYEHDERAEGDGRPVPWNELTLSWKNRYLSKADAALAKAGRRVPEVAGDGNGDYPVIYLQAETDADYAGEGRLWCQDDVWSGESENSPPTKYVRADIAADAERRVQELLHMLELVKSVLDENRFVGDNNPLGIRDIVGAAIHHKGTRKCSTP